MSAAAFGLRPLSARLGVEATGLDAAEFALHADPASVDLLLQALDRHLVLLFRGTKLAPDDLEAFGSRFGALFKDRIRGDGSDGAATKAGDAIKTIGNTAVGGEMAGSFGTEAQFWHTDGSHRREPNAYSVLRAAVAPPVAPRTFWLSAYDLYEGLPARLKGLVADLHAVHSVHGRSQGFWNFYTPQALSPEQRTDGPRHPLVRLHPRTNRPLLYLPRRRDAQIEGWSAERSRVLLERLWAEVARVEEPLGLPLEAGDLIIFDNRATLHAREGWEPHADRAVMHLGIQGEPTTPAFTPPAGGPAPTTESFERPLCLLP